MTLAKMDNRCKGLELFLQSLVLIALVSQVCSLRSGIYSGDIRTKRSEEGPKQVYLFLKLWSPPLLHYHEDLPPKPTKPDRRLSPLAFYHAYGKRSHGCEHHQKSSDERFREFARQLLTQPKRSTDYSQEDDSDW